MAKSRFARCRTISMINATIYLETVDSTPKASKKWKLASAKTAISQQIKSKPYAVTVMKFNADSLWKRCGWCQLAFNSSLTYIWDQNQEWSSICSSRSVTFAPIPASASALVSAWNASYTGYIPSFGGGKGSKSTPTARSRNAASITSTSSSSPRESGEGEATSVFFGGGGGGSQTTAPPLVIPSRVSLGSTPSQTGLGIESKQRSARAVYVILLGFITWGLLY